MRWIFVLLAFIPAFADGITTAKESALLGAAPPLENVVPELGFPDHMVRDPKTAKPWQFPVVVPPFEEHVRGATIPNPENASVAGIRVEQDEKVFAYYTDRVKVATSYELTSSGWLKQAKKGAAWLIAGTGNTIWMADTDGGLSQGEQGQRAEKLRSYGVDGPLSTKITGLAAYS